MKKRILALISIALCGAMMLAACGGGAESAPSSGSSESSAESSAESKTEGESQADAGPVTLKVWCVKEDTVEDVATNEYIKWLEAEANVNLEFEQASSAESLQKFNLSLASGSYPDVYIGSCIQNMTGTLMSSALIKYGGAGILIPLNDLIETYGTNTKQLFSDVPWVKDGVTMPDGNIYALPTYSEIYHCKYSQKMWIDQSWLDNLNLKMPATTDEYYETLKAFKEQDANGNGDPNDEIPMAGCINAWHSDPSSFLMNAFIYDDDDKRLMVNDSNEVESILDKDAYREGLKYINKLYSEGMIYSESFAQDGVQLKSLTSQSPNIVGGFPVGAPMGVVDASADLYKTCVAVPPLKGPEGNQTAGYYDYGNLRSGAYMITSACENPEAAFKLADFMYTEDSSIRLRQGVFGTDWRMAEEGEKTFDDKPAEFARITPLVTSGEPQNNNWGNSGLFRETNDSFIGAWAVGKDFDIRSLDGIEQLLIEATWPYEGYEPEKTLPPVVFTDEESETVNSIEVEVRKYAAEQRVLFITGQKNLDSDWDSYISDLQSLGLDTMVKSYNTAYQRQYANG